jgi:Pro-kumamolisin, activation domain
MRWPKYPSLNLVEPPAKHHQLILYAAVLCLLFFIPILDAQTVPVPQAASAFSLAELAGGYPAPSDMTMQMEFNFKIRNRDLLQALADNDPKSRLYGKKLTQAQFHDLFGTRPADYQAAKQWLRANGFIITMENYGSGALDTISFKGTVDK